MFIILLQIDDIQPPKNILKYMFICIGKNNDINTPIQKPTQVGHLKKSYFKKFLIFSNIYSLQIIFVIPQHISINNIKFISFHYFLL